MLTKVNCKRYVCQGWSNIKPIVNLYSWPIAYSIKHVTYPSSDQLGITLIIYLHNFTEMAKYILQYKYIYDKENNNCTKEDG